MDVDLKYNTENLSEMTHAVPAGTGDPAASAVAAWKNSASQHRHMFQSWDLTGMGVCVAPGGTTLCHPVSGRTAHGRAALGAASRVVGRPSHLF